jgi:hypothetical protein
MRLDTALPTTHLLKFYLDTGFQVVDEVQWTGKNYRSGIMEKHLPALPSMEFEKQNNLCYLDTANLNDVSQIANLSNELGYFHDNSSVLLSLQELLKNGSASILVVRPFQGLRKQLHTRP